MSDRDLARISAYLSNPETNPSWVSPIYDDKSRREIANWVYDHVIDNESYNPEGEYDIVDLFTGSAMLPKEILDVNEERQDPEDIRVTAVDIAPPEYAWQLEEEYPNLEVLQQDAGEAMADIENVDATYSIDGFQVLSGEEFENLADKIAGSSNFLMFNSVHSILDVFEELEDLACQDVNFVENNVVNAPAYLEDIDARAPIRQAPSTLREYTDSFSSEERGFEVVESGSINSATDSIPEIAEAVENTNFNKLESEDFDVEYDYAIMSGV